LFVLGGIAFNNNFLKMVDMHSQAFVVMVVFGCFMLVAAAIGVTASYTKNQCLAFVVRFTLGNVENDNNL
jgi:hypothetical protein